MKKTKLSVVLATLNEEKNIGRCLKSVKDIADEIIIVDENSTDRTREIAQKFNAKVYQVIHEDIFHKTKQKALNYAKGDWVLQLDADEVVSKKLAKEIRKVIKLNDKERSMRDCANLQPDKNRLFLRYQKIIEGKYGAIGKNNRCGRPRGSLTRREIVAYFIPRVNYFLGKPIKYAGVYPDAVIRLVKNGKAQFPCKSVHELMRVDGDVAWLCEDLKHYDSPTIHRYLERANRYTDLTAEEYKKRKVGTSYLNLFAYSFLIPMFNFFKLYFVHKGFLDGMRGFVWSLFSSLHFPLAYFKYWQKAKEKTV